MATYILHPFGAIDTDHLEECYEAKIEFQDETIELDLNFELEKTTNKKLDIVKSMIENLETLNEKNKVYIQDDFENADEEVVKDYIRHHLTEIESEKLSSLIDLTNNKISKEEQLLRKLTLCRVGYYPESKEHFAVFDYTIGKDLTDYMVVINVDSKMKIHCMTQES